jgi:hypothetical protein
MARFAAISIFRAPSLRRDGLHFLKAAGEAQGATRYSCQNPAVRMFAISLGSHGHDGLPPIAMAGAGFTKGQTL